MNIKFMDKFINDSLCVNLPTWPMLLSQPGKPRRDGVPQRRSQAMASEHVCFTTPPPVFLLSSTLAFASHTKMIIKKMTQSFMGRILKALTHEYTNHLSSSNCGIFSDNHRAIEYYRCLKKTTTNNSCENYLMC